MDRGAGGPVAGFTNVQTATTGMRSTPQRAGIEESLHCQVNTALSRFGEFCPLHYCPMFNVQCSLCSGIPQKM